MGVHQYGPPEAQLLAVAKGDAPARRGSAEAHRVRGGAHGILIEDVQAQANLGVEGRFRSYCEGSSAAGRC